jgi:hypothetical protein
MNYSVDIESLRKNFPAECQVPSLLLDFGSWLQNKPAGSLGYFSLQAERFSDYWIENGADLHPNFALFIRGPTGSQIGYWLYNGRTTLSPPIVMVGSEGELSVLSETLGEFLSRLAEGSTRVSDLDSRDQRNADGKELSRWLVARTSKAPVDSPQGHPDLTKWIEEWGRQQRNWISNDPAYIQIADELRKYVRPNAKPWRTANFDVLLVGTQFRMWHRSGGPKPMPQDELPGLERLFRSVREKRAQKVPERGLWFSSWVRVGPQGAANLCCNFMDQPKILDKRPRVPAVEYDRDLHAFPRSNHWMPEWLI